jgi:hypothetical protein
MRFLSACITKNSGIALPSGRITHVEIYVQLLEIGNAGG